MSRASLKFQIFVDKTERLGKCTILPLIGREDFDIVRIGSGDLPPLTGDFLLHPDGAPLVRVAGAAGDVRVAAIDCNWSRLAPILRRVPGTLPPLARIPDGFVTAYPRRNKQDRDPPKGLATIEALFLAAAFRGIWDETLFDQYYFKAAFLAQNTATFAAFGLGPAN